MGQILKAMVTHINLQFFELLVGSIQMDSWTVTTDLNKPPVCLIFSSESEAVYYFKVMYLKLSILYLHVITLLFPYIIINNFY